MSLNKNNTTKRSSRVKSPLFRKKIGEKLRAARQERGYSLSDITDMTEIPAKTILEIEKGLTINIDYYVEYSKSVDYDMARLSDVGIKLVPSKELSAKKQKRVFLTKKIREYIIISNYLQEGKTTEQIKKYLVSLKLIDNTITSTDITGVMKNFVKDETVKVLEKIAGKNSYILHKQPN